MKTNEEKKFLFLTHVKPDQTEEQRQVINYVYGYSQRNGQSMPILTIAIVPSVDENNELYFGVGLSICSKFDNPSKKLGRRIATARAMASFNTDVINLKSFCKKNIPGRVCGQKMHWENAPVQLDNMNLNKLVRERVLSTFKYLARMVMPDITEV